MSRLDIDEKLRQINTQGALHRIVRKSVPALVESAQPLDRKVIRLRRIADEVAKVIAPLTPCAKGCSACCHKPTIINELDAMLIGQSTGTPVATPKRILHVSGGVEAWREYVSPYAGVPCVFLKDGLCSIYAHRPMVCRVHHSLEDSAAGCEGGRQPKAVDLSEIFLGEIRMMGPLMVYADIREFFPRA